MKRIFGALLVLVLAVGLCTTSWAAEDNTYLDETGEAQPIPGGAVTVTQDSIDTIGTNWSGWYVVEGNVEITEAIALSDMTHLILKDGYELKINRGINGSGKALHIYGQRGGSGKLTIDSGYDWTGYGGYAGIYDSDVFINGGIITITPREMGESWGMNVNSVTVNGGTLKATGGKVTTGRSVGVYGDTVTINGGTVIAAAGEGSTGSDGVRVANSIRVTGGSLTASGSGDNGRWIGFAENNVTVTIPAICWWRTAKDRAYNTQDAWDADTSIEGAYMELTTTDPTPVKHYYYAPVEETEEAVEAPKTADPGAAVYGVMAAMSVLGMGVVKKKAF